MRRECYCLALALFLSSLSAQTNDSGDAAKGGITGTVVEIKSGTPVRKATVVLRSNQDAGIGTTTDAAGKFTLRDLAPGAYFLTAERSGFVAHGESARKTVNVKAGETTADVKIILTRTGAVSGRIIDPDGEPISGVSVQLIPVRKARSDRQGGFGFSDDRGEYRAYDVAPGDYRVSATYASHYEERQIHIQRPASGAGSVSDAYPTVYYPAALDVKQASTVTVTAGAEVRGIDIQLIRQHAVRIRGRVAGTAGSVFTVVSLQPRGGPPFGGQQRTVFLRGAKGDFELSDVLPGSYILRATTGGISPDGQLVGHQMVEVGDADVDDIEVTVGPTRKVAGRLIAPEGRKIPAGLMVTLATRDAGGMTAGGVATVAADATFSMDHVQPGDYDVSLASITPSGDDLYVSAIRMADADALADGVHIGEGAPASLDIFLKADGGTADVKVEDDKGAGVASAMVALVPDEPRGRQFALYGNCMTDPTGACKITGIAPGEYHVYPFTADNQADTRDPESLKPFEKYGKAVKFDQGQTQAVTLRAAPSD